MGNSEQKEQFRIMKAHGMYTQSLDKKIITEKFYNLKNFRKKSKKKIATCAGLCFWPY